MGSAERRAQSKRPPYPDGHGLLGGMNNAIATLNCSLLTALTLLLASTTLSLLAEPEANRKSDSKSSNAISNDYCLCISGEGLWCNNSMRCHSIRPPSLSSNSQWEVFVHHMRLRANITGAEPRAMAEFLKCAEWKRIAPRERNTRIG